MAPKPEESIERPTMEEEEEAKAAQNTPGPNPTTKSLNTIQTSTMTPPPPPPPLPQPPQTTKDSLPLKIKKRPLESNNNLQIQNSNYFKIRAVLKDLRPHFIEVLHTPDFRNCKVADEIREKTKLLMDQYKQMTAETVSIRKCNNEEHGQLVLGVNQDAQKPQELPQNGKPAEQPLPDWVFTKPSEEKPVASLNTSEKQQYEDDDDQTRKIFVVGRSAFGWNFVTYPVNDNKAVYYGVTKESFRSQNNS